MYDELIKEYNILIAKESYEAFTYFRQGNKAILKLVDNKKYDIEQYLGHKFLYDCENYAIKFKLSYGKKKDLDGEDTPSLKRK